MFGPERPTGHYEIAVDAPVRDPLRVVFEVAARVRAKARRRGRTVLLSGHVLSEIEQIADHAMVLANGRLIRFSGLATLRAQAGLGCRVRIPDSSRLSSALDTVGVAYRWTDDQIDVETPPEQVGEIAAACGAVLHALAGTADLETSSASRSAPLVRNQIIAVVCAGMDARPRADPHPHLPCDRTMLPGGAAYAALQLRPSINPDGKLLPSAVGGLLLVGHATTAVAVAVHFAPRRDVL